MWESCAAAAASMQSRCGPATWGLLDSPIFKHDIQKLTTNRKFAKPWPRACQITSSVLLTFTFFRTFFWNICNGNRLKQHYRFFGEKKQWKQIRTAFWARTVVSCLRRAHARWPLWEPPDMLIGTCFHVGRCFFWSHFRNSLFMKNDAKWNTKCLQKLRESC